MIEINNLTISNVDKSFLKRVAKKVLKGENVKKGSLSIVLVSSERIKSLNKKHRKKSQPTDVLSFSGAGEFPSIPENEIGEVVICPSIVKKNAKKLNLDYNKELARVLIHGVLHLLGYEHEKSSGKAQEMRKKEEDYL